MKKVVLLSVVVGLLYSCSNDEFVMQSDRILSAESMNHRVELSEATDIAESYFNYGQTRSASNLEVSYVVETGKATKGASSGSDTLAYIFNNGVNDGFVLVATDDRVFPLLAFSDEGHFAYDKDDIVYDEFISKLGDYYERNSSNDTYNYDIDEFFDSCVLKEGILENSWNQGEPFDKYVIQEHPGCPVGCVAVATGMIMTYCKYSMTYHGEYFNNEQINEGLTKDVNSYEYITAADRAAKLLYYIGKDVNMSYSPSGSGAVSADVIPLLNKENFNLKYNNLVDFNILDAINDLEDNYILYMRGGDINGLGGHAWVADGYAYCYEMRDSGEFGTSGPPFHSDEIDEETAFIHCNWGWGGDDTKYNGFFSGDVFSISGYNFGNMQYFAVYTVHFSMEPGTL